MLLFLAVTFLHHNVNNFCQLIVIFYLLHLPYNILYTVIPYYIHNSYTSCNTLNTHKKHSIRTYYILNRLDIFLNLYLHANTFNIIILFLMIIHILVDSDISYSETIHILLQFLIIEYDIFHGICKLILKWVI